MKKVLFIFTALFSFSSIAGVLSYSKVKLEAKNILEKNSFGLTETTPEDIQVFCPRYKKLNVDDKENFWAHFVTNIVRYESSYNPSTTFKENNGNVSAGLLQISYGSISPVYKEKGCNIIKKVTDLKEPAKNLKCGFAIISYWLGRDKNLAKSKSSGASRYWSTLRKPYSVYIKSIGKTVTVGKRDKIVGHIKANFPTCF